MKNAILLSIFFTCLNLNSTAQTAVQRKLDSLIAIIPTSNQDTQKVLLLSSISDNYFQIDPGKGLSYGRQALELSEKLNYSYGIIASNIAIGRCHAIQNNFSDALKHYQAALVIAQKNNKQFSIATIFVSLGAIYSNKNEFDNALNYLMKAKDAYEKAGVKNTSILMTNIGVLYMNQNKFSEALTYFMKGVEMEKENNAATGVLASLYSNAGAVNIHLNNYENALNYLFKALDIQQKMGNNRSAASTLNNIGKTYFDATTNTEAKLPDSLKNKEANLKKALYYEEQSMALCQSLGLRNMLLSVYTNISNIYQTKGNFETALDYFNKYDLLKDSLRDISKEKEFAKVEAEFLVQKKTDSLKYQNALYNEQLKQEQLLAQQSLQQLLIAGKEKEFQKLLLLKTSSDLEQEQDKRKKQLVITAKEKALQNAQLRLKDKELKQKKMERDGFLAGMLGLMTISFLSYRSYRLKRRANKALLLAKEHAEESEKFKQQFLDTMSHEIRTPLNAILGMSRLLKNQPANIAKQQEYIEGINTSSSLLLQTINDILDLSKIDAEKITLEKIPFSIKEQLEKVKQVLQLRANEKKLNFIVSVATDIPEVVSGDPARLNQVIMNLASNAVKFTAKGSVIIEASCINKNEKEATIQFSVTDTGIGISKKNQDTIFESFMQADVSHTREYGGTGLGLSISRKLIALQGGEMNVESDEGLGSCFSFCLKYEISNTTALKAQQASGNIMHYDISGLRILIADDNKYNLQVAEEQLKSVADVRVNTAGNGKEAIDLVKENEYDIILMDMQMPVMDGIEATRFIRTRLSSPKKDIPVIALTASMLRTDLKSTKEAGINDFVIKPFELDELVAAIGKACKLAVLQSSTNVKDTHISNGIDLSLLRKNCNNDEQQLKSLINTYFDTVSLTVEELDMAITAGDWKTCGSIAHSLRPKLDIMGMTDAAMLARNLEFIVQKDNEAIATAQMAKELLIHLKRSLQELKKTNYAGLA